LAIVGFPGERSLSAIVGAAAGAKMRRAGKIRGAEPLGRAPPKHHIRPRRQLAKKNVKAGDLARNSDRAAHHSPHRADRRASASAMITGASRGGLRESALHTGQVFRRRCIWRVSAISYCFADKQPSL
jgi:hypothetical protein